MRFRRMSRRRTRRPGMNMIPLSICSNGFNAPSGIPCGTNTADLFSLGLFGEEFSSADLGSGPRQSAQVQRKGLLVRGLRFHWAVFQSDFPGGGSLFDQYYLATRAAIVRVTVDEARTPLQTVNLFSKLESEVTDILWRGAHLAPGLQVTPCDPESDCGPAFYGSANNFQVGGTMYRGDVPPVHVKTARRLNKDEGLFLAVQTHNPLIEGLDIGMGLEFYGVAAVRSIQR